jgi:hypothetical protein
MLKKVLGGTMAMGLAAFLSLPALAVALPQTSGHTSIQPQQLALVKKSSKKKKKGHQSQKPKPTTPSQQSLNRVQPQSLA